MLKYLLMLTMTMALPSFASHEDGHGPVTDPAADHHCTCNHEPDEPCDCDCGCHKDANNDGDAAHHSDEE